MSSAYAAALRRLLEVPSSPRLGLARMEELLARLGDPQLRFSSLHVAGTNGKGSVVALTDAALGAAGVLRARTTSPHLSSATERIVLAGAPVSEAAFVDLEERAHAASALMEDAPTFFERVIAMAFLAFAEAGIEVAAVEVGLGGRLDATNVLLPRAVAITRLGLDHTQYLGDTLEAVAREKAGIFKAGVPAVSAPQEPAAEAELIRQARSKGVSLRFVDEELLERAGRMRLGFGGGGAGRENAAVALALLEASGLPGREGAWSEGFAAARWPGRYERVSEAPCVVLDGAHNELGMRALADALAGDDRLPRPLHVVFGMTRGHDVRAVGRALVGLKAERVRVTKARAPRSRPAAEVAAELAAEWIVAAVVEPGAAAVGEAVAAARAEGGSVLVTGSLYLVGEARQLFLPGPEDPALPDF
jgi:dihydrofolate synthase / folylpolyglutamate synthase